MGIAKLPLRRSALKHPRRDIWTVTAEKKVSQLHQLCRLNCYYHSQENKPVTKHTHKILWQGSFPVISLSSHGTGWHRDSGEAGRDPPRLPLVCLGLGEVKLRWCRAGSSPREASSASTALPKAMSHAKGHGQLHLGHFLVFLCLSLHQLYQEASASGADNWIM